MLLGAQLDAFITHQINQNISSDKFFFFKIVANQFIRVTYLAFTFVKKILREKSALFFF